MSATPNITAIELSFDGQIVDTVQVGARYTYINRNLDAQDPNNPPLPGNGTFHLTGVPYSQLFAYLTWDVTPRLSITPNVQLASDRWTQLQSGTLYFKTGAFTLINLEAEFDLTERIGFQVGARNLFDQDYQLMAGFPSEGRSFFVNLRATVIRTRSRQPRRHGRSPCCKRQNNCTRPAGLRRRPISTSRSCRRTRRSTRRSTGSA